jgi:hypothetical protein
LAPDIMKFRNGILKWGDKLVRISGSVNNL